MKKIDFRKIINEEISEFNFLGVDDMLKEQEEIELLQNEEFQKQFIIDSITNLRDKIKIIETETANIQEPDYDIHGYGSGDDKAFFEYYIKIEYTYNEKPIEFALDFNGEVSLSWGSSYDSGRLGGTPESDIEPSGGLWINYFEWNDIKPILKTISGDDIEFSAFENAGEKTQELFIRAYVEDIIIRQMDADLQVDEPPQYNSLNLQY